jgi:hypothetical protein
VDTLGEELPRFWARHIPKFVLAHHVHGVFNDIEVHDMSDQIKEWEDAHQDELSMLATLLRKIVDVVRGREDNKLELVHTGGDQLEFREQLNDAGRVLSDDVKSQWLNAQRTLGVDGEEPVFLAGSVPGAIDDEDDVTSWSDGGELDYTACSAEDCGYCGKCTY